jgi:myo-inositol-1(or 4)-monophosphatase
MRRFGGPPAGVERKSSETDLVSEADREAERAIAGLLRAERPDDGLLGEEAADVASRSGRRWVVDPLDGTINYLYGLREWCVSVAMEDADGVAVGVIHHPTAGETYRAVRAQGAELDGRPLAVSGHDRLETALIATGFGYDAEVRAAQARALDHVLPRVRDIRRAGSAALDLAWLAAGRLDGYFERGGNAWDWAAASLLVVEAGGVVERLAGEPEGLAAASPALLPALVALVRKAEAGARSGR